MLQIRRMTLQDVPFGMRLVEVAGWNQIPADWERLLRISPDGCFVAEWDGAPAGTATTTAYGADLAWIGMVLVQADFRQRGIGIGLLRHCVEHLLSKSVRTIKLDATDQGRAVYEKEGFADEYGVTRFVGELAPRGVPPDRYALRPLTAADVPHLADIDREAFGADRRELLGLLARQQPDRALVAAEAGHVVGYGFARPGRTHGYIGPIVASEMAAAQVLAGELYRRLGGRAVLLDAPEPNVEWVCWLQDCGLLAQRRLTRMFRGANDSPGDPRRTFALSAFETG